MNAGALADSRRCGSPIHSHWTGEIGITRGQVTDEPGLVLSSARTDVFRTPRRLPDRYGDRVAVWRCADGLAPGFHGRHAGHIRVDTDEIFWLYATLVA